MKTFDYIQAMISHTLKDPHSKALEPDCLSSFAGNCDTVSKGDGIPGRLKPGTPFVLFQNSIKNPLTSAQDRG